MPWRGRSVLADAPALARLAEAVERSLLGEHSTPVARLLNLSIPWRQKSSQKQELQDSLPVANLTGDGEVRVQSLDRGMDAKGSDGKPGRIGAEPNEASVELRDQLRREVAAAFGVAPGLLFAESGSAQSTRELRSLWIRSRILPVLDSLGAELLRVFDAPVSWSVPLLDAERSESEGRSKSRRAAPIGNLTRAGLSVEQATETYDGAQNGQQAL